MPFAAVAVIGAAAALGGAVIGSGASKSAANTQANAINNATAEQERMFSTVQAEQAPFLQGGYNALADIETGQGQPVTGGTPSGGIAPGYFNQTFTANDLNTNLAPNYAFQLGQGLGAIKNAGNLQTGLISGNTLKGVNDYAQNFAGNAYQQAYNNFNQNQTNIFNRLASVAGIGQTAGQTNAAAGTTLGTGIAGTTSAAGAAAAAGQIGSANSISGGLSNAAGWYGLSRLMNNNQTYTPTDYNQSFFGPEGYSPSPE